MQARQKKTTKEPNEQPTKSFGWRFFDDLNQQSLVIQNPQIPGKEVFGTPKSLLRRCLGVQKPTQQVFGCLLGCPWKLVTSL